MCKVVEDGEEENERRLEQGGLYTSRVKQSASIEIRHLGQPRLLSAYT